VVKSKKLVWMVASAMMLLVCGRLHAQGGCVNSPENATAVLALVGCAGALVAAWRGRRRRVNS
jgi:XrtJ-associated TM-motif-TM protein